MSQISWSKSYLHTHWLFSMKRVWGKEYDAFPVESSTMIDLKTRHNIVHGGFPLNRVKWNVACVSIMWHTLIKHNGDNGAVVFDGYEDVNSTKRQEQ